MFYPPDGGVEIVAIAFVCQNNLAKLAISC